MNITIISPTHTQNYTQAIRLDLETTTGDLTILANHAPTIVSLKANSRCSIYLSDQTTPTVMSVPNGIAHVTRSNVTLLIGT